MYTWLWIFALQKHWDLLICLDYIPAAGFEHLNRKVVMKPNKSPLGTALSCWQSVKTSILKNHFLEILMKCLAEHFVLFPISCKFADSTRDFLRAANGMCLLNGFLYIDKYSQWSVGIWLLHTGLVCVGCEINTRSCLKQRKQRLIHRRAKNSMLRSV